MSEQYKKKKDKKLYIERLRHDQKCNSRDMKGKGVKLKIAGNSKEKVSTGILPGSGQECATIQDISEGGKKSPLSTDSLVTSLQISALNWTKDKIQTLPTKLREFTDSCRNSNIGIHEALAKAYFTERENFSILLKSIILIAPNKKTKNKLSKFQFIINNKQLYNSKVQYYLRLMHRLIKNNENIEGSQKTI